MEDFIKNIEQLMEQTEELHLDVSLLQAAQGIQTALNALMEVTKGHDKQLQKLTDICEKQQQTIDELVKFIKHQNI